MTNCATPQDRRYLAKYPGDNTKVKKDGLFTLYSGKELLAKLSYFNINNILQRNTHHSHIHPNQKEVVQIKKMGNYCPKGNFNIF